MSKVDFKTYGKRFKSVTGVLGALFAALPFLTLKLSDEIGGLLFPPLGNLVFLGRIGATGLGLLTAIVVYHRYKDAAPQSFGKRVSALALFTFVCFIVYFAMNQNFVCKNYIRDKKMEVAVSVGFKRTSDAAIFKDKSNTEMLQERGFEEAEIQRLWTGSSILIVRLLLFSAYTGIIVSVVGILSLTALRDALES